MATDSHPILCVHGCMLLDYVFCSSWYSVVYSVWLCVVLPVGWRKSFAKSADGELKSWKIVMLAVLSLYVPILVVFLGGCVLDLFFECLKIKKVLILRGQHPSKVMALHRFLKIFHFSLNFKFHRFFIDLGINFGSIWGRFWETSWDHLVVILGDLWTLIFSLTCWSKKSHESGGGGSLQWTSQDLRNPRFSMPYGLGAQGPMAD